MAFAAVTSGTAHCLCERLDVEGDIGLSDSLLELYIFVFCLFIYGLITVFFVFFLFLSFFHACNHSFSFLDKDDIRFLYCLLVLAFGSWLLFSAKCVLLVFLMFLMDIVGIMMSAMLTMKTKTRDTSTSNYVHIKLIK